MDEISTGISRRGFVLGGVTAGVAAMAAGGLDTSIVGLIRGYACRRGFQLFHVLLILKKPGKMSPALGSLPNGKPITLYHVLYENPRELEAFSDVSGISSPVRQLMRKPPETTHFAHRWRKPATWGFANEFASRPR